MTLAQEMKVIRDRYANLQDTLSHNATLIDIFEGNLLKYLDKDLKAQLSAGSYEQCKHRLAPINLLNKIVEKLSGVYNPGPTRRILVGNDQDAELLSWYTEHLKPNEYFLEAAEALAMCKSMLVQPFVHMGAPRMRVVANDFCFVMSADRVDPMFPTHVVTFKFEVNEETQTPQVEYTAYTDDEFLIFNDKDEVDHDDMNELENPEGINPFGKLPFVYRSASKKRLVPTPDSDMLQMTKLIPLLFSDLNYAVMFQAFSILYGINVDDENLKMAPNAFWRFKSDPNTDQKPEVGVIKPEVDIEAVLTHIQTQLSLWLNSRGIRPGAVGTLTKDNFANGISKMIDEMDTVELRQKLADLMAGVEVQFWDLVMNHMHPVWVQQGLIDNKALFSSGCKVEVVFSTQLPLTDRGKMVADLKLEQESGFTTQKRAIKTLNPLLSDKDIDELIAEIETAAGGAEGEGGAAGTVQQLSLNGTQVDSLVQVLERVSAGTLPKESGKAILKAAFAITDETIAAIIDPIVAHSVPIEKTSFGGKGAPMGAGGGFGQGGAA